MEFKCQPVTVSKGGFMFCRWSVAAMLWSAFFLRQNWLVVMGFVFLLLSALLSVRRAPLVKLYDWTLGRIIKSGSAELDLYGMYFAHTLGSLLALTCVLFLYFGDPRIGRGILFVFCILKTVSAVGLCPGEKLYRCMSSGSCCAFLKTKES